MRRSALFFVTVLVVVGFTPPAAWSQCASPPGGMISWWKGDTTPLDVGSAYGGVLRGGMGFAPGHVADAFTFDGVDDYVDVGDVDALDALYEMTVEMWFRTSDLSQGVVILYSKTTHNSFPVQVILCDDKVGASFQSWMGDVSRHAADGPISSGTWHHVAAVYDSSEPQADIVRLYVDGVLQSGTGTSAGCISTADTNIIPGQQLWQNGGPVIIGARDNGASVGNFFEGDIDEVSVYGRALTAAEVAAIYNAGTSGKCFVAEFQSENVFTSAFGMPYLSITTDAVNNPHVAFMDRDPQDLLYAVRTGSSWAIETVDATGSVDGECDIKVDGNGDVHIAYKDDNNDLAYALKSGGGWTLELVDGDEPFGISIAFDQLGNPHIAYETGSDIKYATKNGAWSTEAVPDACLSPLGYPSIAVDLSDDPHIAYYDGCTGDLNYAHKSGGSWTVTTVDAGGDVGEHNDIVYDFSSQEVFISYRDDTNDRLKLATKSGTWSVETVPGVSQVHSNAATAVDLDSDGDPHIFFSQWDEGWYVLKKAGEWSGERVHTDDGFMSMALEPGNEPHFLMTQGSFANELDYFARLPDCDVVPSAIDLGVLFGAGGTLQAAFTIVSTGSETLVGDVTESCAEFSILSGGGPFSLEQGESLTVTVEYAPSLPGIHNCSIETGVAQCPDVALTAEWDPGPSPICQITPPSFDLGTIVMGVPVDTSFTITNIGGGSLVIDPESLCGEVSFLGGDGPGALTTGMSRVVDIRVIATAPGALNCVVEVDSAFCDSVPITATAIGADLIVEYVVGDPSAAGAGDTHQVKASIKNVGDAPSGPFDVQFYYADNDQLDYLTANAAAVPVANLDPDASMFVETTATVPCTAKEFEVRHVCRVDAGFTVTELDENNNEATRPFNILKPYEDVALTGLSISPENVLFGETVTVTFTVTNFGDVRESNRTILIYDKKQPQTNKFGPFPVPEMNACGDQAVGMAQIVIPTTYSLGKRQLVGTVSGVGGVFGEANLANNTRTTTIYVSDTPGKLGFGSGALSINESDGLQPDVVTPPNEASGRPLTVVDPGLGIEVRRTVGAIGAVSVNYTLSPGDATPFIDYNPAGGTLNWADRDFDPKYIPQPVLDDPAEEGGETFTVTLSSPGGGAVLGTSVVQVTIIDDDGPGTYVFNQEFVNVSEAGASAVLSVKRLDNFGKAVDVSYTTVDGDATAGSDYTATSGVLSWAVGETASKNITVSILNSPEAESDETFKLELTSATNGGMLGSPSTATIKILDDVPLPDYSCVITSISGSVGRLSVTVRINNYGDATAGGYDVRLYRSDLVPGSGGPFLVGSKTSGKLLLSGSSKQRTFFLYGGVDFPTEVPMGMHFFTAVVDEADVVLESDESDNTSPPRSVRLQNGHGTGIQTTGNAFDEPPRELSLGNAAPNPFNPTTTIPYDVPEVTRVRLAIYDVAGRRIRTLVNDDKAVGRHSAFWDGMNDRGERVSSGVYFVRMDAGSKTFTQKIVMLK